VSYRELHMLDVKEVLRRWQAEQSARAIARAGVGERKTVGRYIAAAKGLGIGAKDELSDDVVRRVLLAVQERPLPEPSEQWRALQAERERIEKWLRPPPPPPGEPKQRPLRLVRIHELLKRDHSVDVGYTTLRRFAEEELGWHKKRSTVLIADCGPAEEAQMDFGLMGYVTIDGARRKLHALIITLVLSRYMFVWPTLTQTVEDVCAGLDGAWWFFEGMAKCVIPDNASSMIIRASPTSPTLGRSFAEYVQARDILCDPARVEHPQDKGRVENQVAYVRERWFDGEKFIGDLVDIRAHAAHWCEDTAGGRVHGTTCRVPREHYALEEKAHMKPAPTTAFDVPRWGEAKVHDDHHVQVRRALYSIPTAYLHRTVDVRVDSQTVKAYFKNELIKVHPKKPPGGRSTDPNDYPKGKADYAMRNVDGVRNRAAAQGKNIGEFAARLLGGPLPWTRMRQAYALLRLCDRYGVERVEAVCIRALAFDVIDVTRIEKMLKTAKTMEESKELAGKLLPLPKGRFARDTAAFATRPTTEGGAR
jgi:transposase